MSEQKQTERRFGILVTLYWCTNCMMFGYLWTWLSARGFNASEIGLLTAVKTVSGAVGQLLFPAIADRKRNNRMLFMLTVCAALISFLLACAAQGFWLMAAALMLVGLFADPTSCLLDSWIMEHMHGDMNAFGRVRSMGSICYGAVVPLYGLLIDKLGYGIMPFAAGIIGIGCVLYVKMLPKSRPADAKADEPEREKGIRVLRKVIGPGLVVVLLMCFLMGICIMPVYYCSSLAMEAVGGSTALIGLMYFADSATEFVIMRGFGPLKRLSASARLMISLGVYVISTALMFFAQAPWAMFLPLALNGAGYGLQLPARRQLVAELVPERFRTTVNGAADTLYGGLGGVIGSALMGRLTDLHGAAVCMLIAAGMQAVTLLILLITKRSISADRAV